MKSDKIIQVTPLGFPWETKDPFLFCVHHRDEYPIGNGRMGVKPEELRERTIGNDFKVKDGFRMYHGNHVPGFPYHPHRGFETITINKEGFVDHFDSLGSAGRFGAGDVQWMTAGKGVQHSEMFPLVNDGKSNPMEIFQIWLNLPKASKFVEPHYRMLWNDVVPLVKNVGKNGKTTEINVIAGNLNDSQAPAPTPDSWAANPENDVMILTIKMDANASWELPASLNRDINRTLYFYRGESVMLDEEKVEGYHSIHVKPDKELILQNGDTDGYLLLLQGRPINEPVVQHGPFVMNTHEEIQKAYSDYRKTQFGGWPWPESDPVHDKDVGRFAIHANGFKEYKS